MPFKFLPRSRRRSRPKNCPLSVDDDDGDGDGDDVELGAEELNEAVDDEEQPQSFKPSGEDEDDGLKIGRAHV